MTGVAQETPACGEESFYNNLVKMFKLPALTLALGGGASCPLLALQLWREKPQRRLAEEHPARGKGVLWLRGADPSCLCHLPSAWMERCWNLVDTGR